MYCTNKQLYCKERQIYNVEIEVYAVQICENKYKIYKYINKYKYNVEIQKLLWRNVIYCTNIEMHFTDININCLYRELYCTNREIYF